MAKPVNSDQKTLALINDVKARKAEIQKILGKPSFETNMSFSYSEGKSNDNVNLHTVTSVSDLVKIASFLSTREDSYDEMSKALQVEDPTPFTWQGFTVHQWLSDIKIRVAKVQVAKKQKKLEALEARLNLIISPELRAEMELEAIANELG